jgi:hypothetical protein
MPLQLAPFVPGLAPVLCVLHPQTMSELGINGWVTPV